MEANGVMFSVYLAAGIAWLLGFLLGSRRFFERPWGFPPMQMALAAMGALVVSMVGGSACAFLGLIIGGGITLLAYSLHWSVATNYIVVCSLVALTAFPGSYLAARVVYRVRHWFRKRREWKERQQWTSV